MKYILFFSFLSFLFICSCQKTTVDIIEKPTINNKSNFFSAGRAEGLNASNAYPDYGKKVENLTFSEEEIIIINKWQNHLGIK